MNDEAIRYILQEAAGGARVGTVHGDYEAERAGLLRRVYCYSVERYNGDYQHPIEVWTPTEMGLHAINRMCIVTDCHDTDIHDYLGKVIRARKADRCGHATA